MQVPKLDRSAVMNPDRLDMGDSRHPQVPASLLGCTCFRVMTFSHRIYIAADYRTARRPAQDFQTLANAVQGDVSHPMPHAAVGQGRVNFPGGASEFESRIRRLRETHQISGLGTRDRIRTASNRRILRRVGLQSGAAFPQIIASFVICQLINAIKGAT